MSDHTTPPTQAASHHNLVDTHPDMGFNFAGSTIHSSAFNIVHGNSYQEFHCGCRDAPAGGKCSAGRSGRSPPQQRTSSSSDAFGDGHEQSHCARPMSREQPSSDTQGDSGFSPSDRQSFPVLTEAFMGRLERAVMEALNFSTVSSSGSDEWRSRTSTHETSQLLPRRRHSRRVMTTFKWKTLGNTRRK